MARHPRSKNYTPIRRIRIFARPQIYVAIAARFVPNRQAISDAEAAALHVARDYYKDLSDAVLMTTRGGNEYDRTFLSSYIRPGIGARNWVLRTNYPALGDHPDGSD